MKDRKQLNLRLDNEGELLEEIKEAARSSNISLNQFVVNALRTALERSTEVENIARQPLDNLLDRVEALEQSYQNFKERMDRLETRQMLDTALDKKLDGDRDLESTDLHQAIAPVAEVRSERKTYTDAEVARQWGADISYIRDLRLGKCELLFNDKDFWEWWKPLKGKARWHKLKEGLSALRPET